LERGTQSSKPRTQNPEPTIQSHRQAGKVGPLEEQGVPAVDSLCAAAGNQKGKLFGQNVWQLCALALCACNNNHRAGKVRCKEVSKLKAINGLNQKAFFFNNGPE